MRHAYCVSRIVLHCCQEEEEERTTGTGVVDKHKGKARGRRTEKQFGRKRQSTHETLIDLMLMVDTGYSCYDLITYY